MLMSWFSIFDIDWVKSNGDDPPERAAEKLLSLTINSDCAAEKKAKRMGEVLKESNTSVG